MCARAKLTKGVIPTKTREMLSGSFKMTRCWVCGCESVEWEHVFIVAGRQVQEPWSIIPLCYKHHRGGFMIKSLNQYMACVHELATFGSLERMYNFCPTGNWAGFVGHSDGHKFPEPELYPFTKKQEESMAHYNISSVYFLGNISTYSHEVI